MEEFTVGSKVPQWSVGQASNLGLRDPQSHQASLPLNPVAPLAFVSCQTRGP